MTKSRFDEEAFARLLEEAGSPRDLETQRMLALVGALERARPTPAGPNPHFADSLRSRIVAEAEQAARIPVRERALIWLRLKNQSWKRSFRVVTATGMAAMLLMGTSAVLASAGSALPGQWNYPVKRAREAAQMSVTRGPEARGYLELEFARIRLNEIKGMASHGVTSVRLYVDTLNDMDAATLNGSEMLVDASRSGAGIEPLRRLAAFTQAQRSRLESLVVGVPAGARPAARDSLAILVRLNDRVQSIIEGCPCPGNPLELPAAAAGDQSPIGCACEPGTPAASGGGSGNETPSTQPSPQPSGSGTPSPQPGDGNDILPGTDVDEPVNDLVDEVDEILDGLGLPTGTPLPSPSLGL